MGILFNLNVMSKSLISPTTLLTTSHLITLPPSQVQSGTPICLQFKCSELIKPTFIQIAGQRQTHCQVLWLRFIFYGHYTILPPTVGRTVFV